MMEDMARTALAGGGEGGAAEEGEGKVRLQSSYSVCTRDVGSRVGTPHAIRTGAGVSILRLPRGWSLGVSGGAPPPPRAQQDGEGGRGRFPG
jgi:hypothetical protein